MIKNKLYMRAFSTILSVLTIFSGTYNNGVKAVEEEKVKKTVQTDKAKVASGETASHKEVKRGLTSPAQPNASKGENKTKQSSNTDAEKPDAAIQTPPSINLASLNEINTIRKEIDQRKYTELLHLTHLFANVLSYCDITKYKWDENDTAAISSGAKQTLTEEQKSEICEMFTYVRTHEQLFNPLTFSGNFVATAEGNFGGPSIIAYKQLREICTKVNTPIPTNAFTGLVKRGLTLFGLSENRVYSDNELCGVRGIFLLHRVSSATSNGKISTNSCIRDALSTVIPELVTQLNLYYRLGYMPNDFTAQLLTAWNGIIDMTTNATTAYIKEDLTPYIKGQLTALSTSVDEKVAVIEGKMPTIKETAKEITADVEHIVKITVPRACASIVATFMAIKVISLGCKYLNKKYFSSPAEKNDRNEPKQPTNAAQKSQRLHKTQQQTIAQNCPQHA